MSIDGYVFFWGGALRKKWIYKQSEHVHVCLGNLHLHEITYEWYLKFDRQYADVN